MYNRGIFCLFISICFCTTTSYLALQTVLWCLSNLHSTITLFWKSKCFCPFELISVGKKAWPPHVVRRGGHDEWPLTPRASLLSLSRTALLLPGWNKGQGSLTICLLSCLPYPAGAGGQHSIYFTILPAEVVAHVLHIMQLWQRGLLGMHEMLLRVHNDGLCALASAVHFER